MNQLNTPKPKIISCFLWLFFGALCSFGFVLTIIDLVNGTGEPFKFSSILSGIVGISMLGRGIKGILIHREDRPLPKSFAFYIWLIIGFPVLISLWALMMALMDFNESWPYILSIFPISIGIMAINSVYEGRGDAFHLIRCYITIYAVGIAANIVNLIIEPTLVNGVSLALKLCIVCFALLYLYKSDSVTIALPNASRSISNIGKWLTIIYIGIMISFVIFCVASVVLKKDYDPSSMTEQYNLDNGYHSDGIVAFKIPSHYIIDEEENDGITIFSISDSETEPTETITIVSELNYELTKEEFDEYYEGWKTEDFAYLSTTIAKEEEDILEGKHYHYKSVYFEEYGTYWDFVIVNQPDINKNCLISIYTSEPGKRAYFFIRGLKFN